MIPVASFPITLSMLIEINQTQNPKFQSLNPSKRRWPQSKHEPDRALRGEQHQHPR